MGTHATWQLWAGITDADLNDSRVTEKGARVLEELLDQGECRLYDDVLVEDIVMHGERVGIGVRIKELDWSTEITEEENVFPLFEARYGAVLVETLKRAFEDLGIKGPIRMYHHLDLGG